jgi:N,N'-diacetyllegionaminate synthase
VEVFDFPSLQLVKDKSAVEAFKIPTADLSDRDFVDAVCSVGKPVFVGVGGATLKEIDAIAEQVLAYDNITLILLHGIQNFPTKLEDSQLNKIQLLHQRYKCQVGFADHIDAEETEMARVLPAMAVAAGASVIEKHITLDRSAKGFDYYSSLNPDEFKEFVKYMQHISTGIGSNDLDVLTNAERTYRDKMKKFAVLVSDVAKGSMVKDAVVKYRRTSSPGITRKEFEDFDNKIFTSHLSQETILNEQHFR